MANQRDAKHTGGCQCGAVRYALYAEPAGPGICHCRMCQKALGGPFGVFTGVARTDFAWTRGTPGRYRSSTLASRDFCAACGTPLTFDFHDGDRMTVAMYTLDNPAAVAQPDRQIGTECRAAWLDELNTFPGKSTQEDSGDEFVASCRSFQHPDHDTGDDWTPPTAAGG